MIKPFFYALQFLTRIPVPLREAPDPVMQGRMVTAYPLVGLMIGVMMAAVHFLLAGEGVGPALQAALVLAFWVGITGALHIDGLADLADAWVGGHGDRERTLEIMKDPTCGPMAVTAVVILLLVKFAALQHLVAAGFWEALLMAPVWGRSGLVVALITLPYVRKAGLGNHAARHLSKQGALIILILMAILTATLFKALVLPLLIALMVFFLLLRRDLMGRIGGLTGDAAGAVCELMEAVGLVLVVLLLA